MLLRLGTRPALVVSSASAVEECFTKNDVVFANRPRLIAGKHLGYNYTSLAWAPYGERCAIFAGSPPSSSSPPTASTSSPATDRPDPTERDRRSGSDGGDAIAVLAAVAERYDEDDGGKEVLRRGVRRLGGGQEIQGDGGGDFPVLRGLQFRRLPAGAGEVARSRPFRGGEDGQATGEEGLSDAVAYRRASRVRGKTMLDVLLRLQETDPDSFKDEDIRSLFLVLLAAGTDTSARTMESALSLMVSSPRVMEKAQAEIDERVGKARVLEESDLNSLPYLRCILQETLRMCPAAPILTPHESSDQCVVGGDTVPRGTMLFVNVWAIQNDPANWDEPEKFVPERFEGGRANVGLKWLPFGSGRRVCPGDGLAMRVVALVVGSMLQGFDWERAGEDNMAEGGMSKPLCVRCKNRGQVLA